MFTKYLSAAALVQILIHHGALATSSSSKNLRGATNNNSSRRDPPDLMELFVPPPDRPDMHAENERRARNTQAKTLTITNNCGTDISNFRGFYNARWVYNATANVFNFQYLSTGSVPIVNGANLTVTGVTEDVLHFYGLFAMYDWNNNKWTLTEVAQGTSPSNTFKPVTFTAGTERHEFPIWMTEIGDDMEVKLCFEEAAPETTTMATSTVAFTTISSTVASTSTTTTTTPTTSTSSTTSATNVQTASTDQSGQPSTFTILNKCGVDIAYFEARYNFRYNEREQYAYGKTPAGPLSANGSIAVSDNTGDTVHFYGWVGGRNASDVYSFEDAFEDEEYEWSFYFPYAELTTPTGSFRDRVYEVEIGNDGVVELCGSN